MNTTSGINRMRKKIILWGIILSMLYCCNYYRKGGAFDAIINEYSKNIKDSIERESAIFLKENMKDIMSDKVNFYDDHFKEIELSLDEFKSEASLLSFMGKKKLDYEMCVVPDTQIVTAIYLKNNIKYAINSWNKYPWCKNIPKNIFLNYLLPYKVFQEYPQEWRQYFFSKYKDSIDVALKRYQYDSADIYAIDPNELYYRIVVDDAGKWYKYSDFFVKLTQYPSLSELLCIGKGSCSETSILNVYILRSLGIPAAVDIVPVWGSKNGSHTSEVFWDGKNKMRTASGREFERPTKVFRLSFKKQNYWNDSVSLFVDRENFMLPYLMNNHWIDVTEEHTKTVDINVLIDTLILPDFAYICVYNYGQWQPAFWGKIENKKAEFKKMGYPMIYRIAVPDRTGFALLNKILLVDEDGKLNYIGPTKENIKHIVLEKTNAGEKSYVQQQNVYELFLLDERSQWISLGKKKCLRDSLITFSNVPQNALLRLVNIAGKKNLERIFTYQNNKQVWW
ncbi:MAG: hypothetical protein QM768_03725 [Agriterribacter sp.]